MKRFLALPGLALLLCALPVSAQSPDSLYVQYYQMIQQAETLQDAKQEQPALDLFLRAEEGLKKIQEAHPQWNPKVVQFRLDYVSRKIKPLAAKFPDAKPSPAAPPSPLITAPAKAPGEPAAAPAPSAAASEAIVNRLNEDIFRLRMDNAILQAKLNEANSARPAAIDPMELARAEDRIKALQRDNDLLKVTLEQAQQKAATMVDNAAADQLKKEAADLSRQLAQQTSTITALTQERDILQQRLQSMSDSPELKQLRTDNDGLRRQLADMSRQVEAMSGRVDPAEAARLQKEVAEANRQLAMQTATVANLTQEKTDLEKRLRAAADSPELKTLRDENAAMKKQVADLTRKAATLAEAEKKAEDLSQQLKTASASVADQQKMIAKLEAVLTDPTVSIAPKAPDAKTAAESQKMAEQLAALRARVEVLEARPAPYTREEMALFKKPETAPTAAAVQEPKPAPKPAQPLPSAAKPLVAEAQRAFAAGRFGEAEQKYQQVVQMSPGNVQALSNLAATQIEQNRLEDAEANLKKALDMAPNDTHSLFQMGYLKYRQNQLDPALDYLSRASQSDPKNSDVHNYLGIVLSEKGQRTAAEAALRKAVQLAPNNASAHHNLAVIYATQTPPALELARWHYQKATSAGHPKNQELEKLLEAK